MAQNMPFISLILVSFIIGEVLCQAAGLLPQIWVDPKSQRFVDSLGRVRVFHGVNVVFKVAPFIPQTDSFDPQLSLCAEDIANLYEWGFNSVRLGTQWEGIEPQRGQYNYTLLNGYEALVNSLANASIYTFLDAHQDVMSRKFCGEGFPDFAVTPWENETYLPFPFPGVLETFPLDPKTGYPDLTYCLKYPFLRYMFAFASNSAWKNFYMNVNNVHEAFGDFWELLAKKFGSNPGVLGYELLNEPVLRSWLGDIYSKNVTTGFHCDSAYLAPLYEYLNIRIRTVDNTKLVFFEQSLVDLLELNDGFTQVPGGAAYNNRSVFSYHVYCGDVNRVGEPSNKLICDLMEDGYFEQKVHQGLALGGGQFMTEWGAFPSLNPIDIETVNVMTGLADSMFQSWTWWQFKSFNDITTASTGSMESFYFQNGTLQIGKVKAMSRTYAYAIAGVPQSTSFSPDTAAFSLTFTIDLIGALSELCKLNLNFPSPFRIGSSSFPNSESLSAKGPTEIFYNSAWYYPNGFKVTVTPNVLAWKKSDLNRLAFVPSATAKNGQLVNIAMTQ